MAVRPFQMPVTVIENGKERPAKAGEIEVVVSWGHMAWEHLMAKTGYTSDRGGTTTICRFRRHDKGDDIAIWARNRGEKGFDAKWYHIYPRLATDQAHEGLQFRITIDDSHGTYAIEADPR